MHYIDYNRRSLLEPLGRAAQVKLLAPDAALLAAAPAGFHACALENGVHVSLLEVRISSVVVGSCVRGVDHCHRAGQALRYHKSAGQALRYHKLQGPAEHAERLIRLCFPEVDIAKNKPVYWNISNMQIVCLASVL